MDQAKAAPLDEPFTPDVLALLAQAESLCAERGQKLTDLRRLVLGLILQSPNPTGAYDLLNQLRGLRRSAAPPTIYRTLEFLQEQGFVHRLERLAAFVGCVDAHGHGHDHPAQFLICKTCGKATEIEDAELSAALAAAAERVGFAVRTATIEADGQCAACMPAGD